MTLEEKIKDFKTKFTQGGVWLDEYVNFGDVEKWFRINFNPPIPIKKMIKKLDKVIKEDEAQEQPQVKSKPVKKLKVKSKHE